MQRQLSHTPIPQFYPLSFVLVTELAFFGAFTNALVFLRLIHNSLIPRPQILLLLK